MITTEDFKLYFARDFPYLPDWENGKAYFIGDVVYDGTNFYQSLIDGNLQALSNTNAWKLYNGDVNEYLQDADIEKAIREATLAFNEELFDNCEDKALAIHYLTAYYVVIDIKNATSGLSSNAYNTFVSSKSVGNVSESYGLPSWVTANPMFSLYMDNGYGKKYLSFIIPRVNGFIYLSQGATTVG